MQDILQKVKRLEIKIRRLVSSHFSGEYRSAFKGSGLEFDEVRLYQYGDDVRFIDWNVSAKLGQLHVKVFREERELNLFVLLDVSASGNFGQVPTRKIDIALEITALLGFCTLANNDRFGTLLFSDQIERYFKPGKGRNHILSIVGSIIKQTNQSPKTNIKQALEYVQKTQKRKAVLFILSDFLDSGYEKVLMGLKQQHDVVLVRLYHPDEVGLRLSGCCPVSPLEQPGTRWIFGQTGAKALQHQFARLEANLRQFVAQHNMGFIDIDVTKDYIPALERFFTAKGAGR
jgi:uncharacterized protein (DUF58 family)